MPPVIVYKHINYDGKAISLEVGNYVLSNLQSKGILNDDISSIKVEEGYKITIYEHDNYGGKKLTLLQSSPNLVPLKWNDIISSIKIEEESTVVNIYDTVKYSSVSLVVTKSDGDYVGSGFIIKHNTNYYICTVAHNILDSSPTNREQHASNIIASVITSTGTHMAIECSIIGIAAYADIAILKMNTPISNLTHLSSTSTPIKNGNKCYVIGDPKGLDAISICEGLIRDNKYTYGNIIKSVCISAPIYGGNSGSPVLNENGEFISIISYGISSTDTISWGAEYSIINTIIDNLLTKYETTLVKPQYFIGGTLNATLYSVDGHYLKQKGKIPYNLIGYYIDNSSNSELTTNNIITSISGNELGVYDGQYTPVDIYLSPSLSLTMNVLNILNDQIISKTLSISPLNLTDDIYLGGSLNAPFNIELKGPLKINKL